MGGAAESPRSLAPGDIVAVAVVDPVEHPGIGLEHLRHLQGDGAELAAQPRLDPGPRFGPVNRRQLVAQHAQVLPARAHRHPRTSDLPASGGRLRQIVDEEILTNRPLGPRMGAGSPLDLRR